MKIKIDFKIPEVSIIYIFKVQLTVIGNIIGFNQNSKVIFIFKLQVPIFGLNKECRSVKICVMSYENNLYGMIDFKVERSQIMHRYWIPTNRKL